MAGDRWVSPSVEARSEVSGRAVALVQTTSGVPAGSWTFIQQGDKVLVQVAVEGLPPGFHGFHIHAAGVCDADAGYTTAGGHFNAAGLTHRDHTGDMPPLYVNEDGTGTLSFTTDRFRVADLYDADGSAVIVHADPDNLAHIPERYGGPDTATLTTGDAGARIACGVLNP